MRGMFRRSANRWPGWSGHQPSTHRCAEGSADWRIGGRVGVGHQLSIHRCAEGSADRRIGGWFELVGSSRFTDARNVPPIGESVAGLSWSGALDSPMRGRFRRSANRGRVGMGHKPPIHRCAEGSVDRRIMAGLERARSSRFTDARNVPPIGESRVSRLGEAASSGVAPRSRRRGRGSRSLRADVGRCRRSVCRPAVRRRPSRRTGRRCPLAVGAPGPATFRFERRDSPLWAYSLSERSGKS